MHASMVTVAAVLLALWPAGIRAECVPTTGPRANGNLTETFESPNGTDNQFNAQIVDPGNVLDPNFWHPSPSPTPWGQKSGRVVVGSQHGGAFWIRRDTIDSPTGYHFTASFLIVVDGITESNRVSLFVSKSQADGKGQFAAWRLTIIKAHGQLQLELLIGAESTAMNPSAARYTLPIQTYQTYDVAITYDTRRRFYLWNVNGAVQAAANMPCDYPLIGIKIIGSSQSSSGRNTVFLVDNVRWYELPK